MGLKAEDPNNSLDILKTHIRVFWIVLLFWNSYIIPRKKNPPLYTINPTKKFLKDKGIDSGCPDSFNFLYVFKEYNNVIDFESPVVEQIHSS